MKIRDLLFAGSLEGKLSSSKIIIYEILSLKMEENNFDLNPPCGEIFLWQGWAQEIAVM